MMTAPSEEVSSKVENQNSIDRILNLPACLDERIWIFERGLKEARRQGILGPELMVSAKLEEIKLFHVDPSGRRCFRDSVKDAATAIAALKENPELQVADGVYDGAGIIALYATATSENSLLNFVSLSCLQHHLKSAFDFSLNLTGIENVVQTIAHEAALHEGLNLGDDLFCNEEIFTAENCRDRKLDD